MTPPLPTTFRINVSSRDMVDALRAAGVESVYVCLSIGTKEPRLHWVNKWGPYVIWDPPLEWVNENRISLGRNSWCDGLPLHQLSDWAQGRKLRSHLPPGVELEVTPVFGECGGYASGGLRIISTKSTGLHVKTVLYALQYHELQQVLGKLGSLDHWPRIHVTLKNARDKMSRVTDWLAEIVAKTPWRLGGARIETTFRLPRIREWYTCLEQLELTISTPELIHAQLFPPGHETVFEGFAVDLVDWVRVMKCAVTLAEQTGTWRGRYVVVAWLKSNVDIYHVSGLQSTCMSGATSCSDVARVTIVCQCERLCASVCVSE